MFGRQSTQMQVVPVDGLAEIIKGVATIRQPTAQPPYTPPQPQPSSTMITIYIQERHVHPQGSWQDGGARQLGQPLTGLPEPQSTYILPTRSIDPNAAAVPPRCGVRQRNSQRPRGAVPGKVLSPPLLASG